MTNDDVSISVDYTDLKLLYAELDKTSQGFQKMVATVNPAVAAAQTFSGKIDTLNQEFEEGTREGALYETVLKQIRDQAASAGVAVDEFGNVSQLTSKRMNSSGVAVQQVGYQVGDFLVQVQSGTNAFVAFGQQATQLVGVLPLLGAGFMGLSQTALIGLSAGLGIAIPLMTAVAAAIMRTNMDSEDLDKTLSNLIGTIEEYSDAIDAANLSQADLNEEFGQFSDVAKEALGYLQEAAKIKSDQSIKAIANQIANLDASTYNVNSRLREFLSLNEMFSEGAAKRAAQPVQQALYGLSSASGAQEQLAALEEVSSAMLGIYGTQENMNEEQSAFFNSVQEAKLALIEVLKSSGSLVSDMKSITSSAQIFAGYQAELKDNVKTITDSINERKNSLSQEIALSSVALSYGKDSAEYKAKEAEIERDKYETLLEQNGILGNNKAEMLEMYDTSVNMASEAERFQSALEKAAGALSSLQSIGANIDKALEVSTKKVQLIQQGVDTATAGTIANYGASLQSAYDEAVASGVDSVQALSVLAEGSIKLAELQKSLTTEKDLTSSSKSGGSSKSQTDYLAKLQQEMDYKQSIIGLTDEQVDRAEYIQDLIKNDVDLSDSRVETLYAQKAALEEAIAADEKRTQYLEGFQSELETMFESIITGTESVGDAFSTMLYNMILDIYKQEVIQPMSSGISSFVSGLFGGGVTAAEANGGVWSKGVKMFANGGVVNSPTMFSHSGGLGVMGEAGPEAIMPLKRGSDGKLGVATNGGSSGPQQVNVTYQINGNGDDYIMQKIAQAAPSIAAATESSILDNRRRGGKFKKVFK